MDNELHVWVAIAGEDDLGRPRRDGAFEIVDFAARHYRNYFDRLNLIPSNERLAWKRPEGPPDYIWAAPRDIPEWVLFDVQRKASEAALDNIDRAEAMQMSALAMAYLSTQTPQVA